MNAWSPVVPEHGSDPRLFMTPRFELLVEGSGLPNNVLRDVSEVTYRDSLTELDQFELTVNNWDSEQRRFKYIGSETDADLTEKSPYKLFEPCGKQVTVSFGYVDKLVTVMLGNFTTMETSFAQSGASTLTVRGLNVFHSMRRKKFSTAWENKTPSQIAEHIGSLSDGGKKRFPVPIKIVEGTKNGEQPIPFVTQTSQFDIDFLLNLARQHGYEIAWSKDKADKKDKGVLLFGRSSEARLPVNYRLDWGRTLVDFKPTLSTAGQFKSITVKGWDRKTQKVIEEKVAHDDKELRRMNAKFSELVQRCDPQEEQVVDLPVFSKADARKRALALMRDNSARIIRASGTTVGLPELRAGTRLKIGNLGVRLSGEYLVTKTTHTLGENGYTTKFECRLEDFEGKPR